MLPTSALPDARAYRQQTERVLEEIAAGAGGVVLGRAGAMVLGERPDVLHVRLDGPRERRLAAAVERSGRPLEEVRREMEANDRTREAYVRHFYRCDPEAARHYHLVVDSTALPVETVVDLVVTAARARGIGRPERPGCRGWLLRCRHDRHRPARGNRPWRAPRPSTCWARWTACARPSAGRPTVSTRRGCRCGSARPR